MKKLIISTGLLYLLSGYYILFATDIFFNGNLQNYISTDFNSQSFHNRSRDFELLNNKKGLFDLNFASIGTSVKGNSYYGTLGVQFGNYAHLFRSDKKIQLQEAFIGYELNKKISFEVGYFLSNKGEQLFKESGQFFSINPIYSYIQPINLAGGKVKYKPSKRFEFSFAALNSIFNTESRTGNLAFSPSIKYKVDFAKITVEGLYGRDKIDNYELFMMFNNFNAEFYILNDLTLGAEYVYFTAEAIPVLRAKPRKMSGLTLTANYNLIPELSLGIRYSNFSNSDSLFAMPKSAKNDFLFLVNYKPSNKSYLRLELRNLLLGNSDKIFNNNDNPINFRTDIAMVFGFYFDRLLNENK